MVAYTGDPRVDFVLSQPDVQRNIRAGKINRKGQVPLLAGADEHDDTLSHIDSRFPRTFPRPGGGVYSPDPHLHVHETVEKWVQENGPQFAGILGLKPGDITTDSPDGQPRTLYGKAHYDFATPAEKASVEADGVDWGAHNAHTAGAYSAIKGQKADASPPTLYDRPYRDDGATGLLQPSKAADMDYSGLLGNGMGGYGGLLGNPGGMGPSDPYYAMMMGLGGQPSQSPQQPQTFPIPGMLPQITPDGSQMGQPPQFAQPQPQDQSGFPQISTYDPASGLPPSMERNFVSGGQLDPSALQESVSYNDPSAANAAATPPAGTPPPASAPAQSGGFFGPQNADIAATLGGALLQGPTLRQGLAIAGQQLPGVMRQSRANNATVDWLMNNQNMDPKMRNLFMQNPQLAQQVAERMMLPQWQWTQIGRDPMGQVTYGWVNPQSHEVRDAAGKPVDPAQLTGASAGGTVDNIVQGIKSGSLPPDLSQVGPRMKPLVEAGLAQAGFDLSRAQEEWKARTRELSSLNSGSQLKLRQQLETTKESLSRIDELAQQWNAGNFPILNHVTMLAALNGGMGPEANKIATTLRQQISDIQSELAGVYRGGNSPTDESLKVAAANLDADWSLPTLQAAIDNIRLNLTFRENAITHVMTSGTGTNRYEQSQGGAMAAPADGAAAATLSAAPPAGGVVSWQNFVPRQ